MGGTCQFLPSLLTWAPGAFRRLRGLRFSLVSPGGGSLSHPGPPLHRESRSGCSNCLEPTGEVQDLRKRPAHPGKGTPQSWEGLLAAWLERPRPQAGAASLSLAPGPRSQLGLESQLDFRGLRSRPGSPAGEGSVCGQLPGWCRKVQGAGAQTRSPWLPQARCCLPGPLHRGSHLTGRQGL